MRRTFFIALLASVLGSSGPALAGDQTPTPGFARELSSLRLTLIPACARIRTDTTAAAGAQLPIVLDSIIERWQGISARYRDVPPPEYARDPAWADYLDEALENFRLMRDRTAAGQRKEAARFCGLNCNLFVTMNQVNGIDRAADRMFLLRRNVRSVMAMVKAGNMAGASQACDETERLANRLVACDPPPGVKAGDFSADIALVLKPYRQFADAVRAADGAGAARSFDEFNKVFASIYVKYV